MYLYLLYFFVNQIKEKIWQNKCWKGLNVIQFMIGVIFTEILCPQSCQHILGGPIDIVEIDESKWGEKRKYHRSYHHENSKPQIFGMICRTDKKVVLQRVLHRDA